MPLDTILAHRIQRPQTSGAATTQLSPGAWPLNGRVDEAFREMKKSMLGRSGKEYGAFSSDIGEYPLYAWLKEFTEQKMPFARFSEQAMTHLKQVLESSELALEGFVVFAFEKLETGDLVHIYFLHHAQGQYIDADMQLSDSLYLDTQGLRLAARVNLADLQSDDDYRVRNALTVLKWRGEKELTDLFLSWLGFTDKRDISAETEAFLGAVQSYTDTLPEEKASETRAHVVDYCLEQEKAGRPVVIKELDDVIHAQHNDDNSAPKQRLSEHWQKQRPDNKPELIPDKQQLKNFVRISGRNEQISMSFASSCLGESIVYDPDSDSLIIKSIPNALKSRLIKHVGKGEPES